MRIRNTGIILPGGDGDEGEVDEAGRDARDQELGQRVLHAHHHTLPLLINKQIPTTGTHCSLNSVPDPKILIKDPQNEDQEFRIRILL